MARPSEPDWRPAAYTVKRGDTLYAIALDHGLDYRDLASWNGIENPNRILVGQVLRLSAPGEGGAPSGDASTGVVTAPLHSAPPVIEGKAAAPTATAPSSSTVAAVPQTGDNYKTAPKAIKEPYSAQAARELARADTTATTAAKAEPPVASSIATTPSTDRTATPSSAPSASGPGAAAAATVGDDDVLEWLWPTKGKLIAGFSETANLKGIDIAGNSGQPIIASAPGKVVYAGTGLRGYGKLVIIKHNKTFLSAYAHNKEIVVKEGQQVTRGQKIAEMGNTDADQVKLHFEIRRLGKPMDPTRYLPPA